MNDPALNLGDHALQYAERGFAVFPLKQDTKLPAIKGWDTKATTDPDQVRELWRRWPNANIGIHCGMSGLVVIDVDPRNGGDATLASLEEAYATRLWEIEPAPAESNTGGGGKHFLFRAPEGGDLPGKNALGPGIDLLYGNHYIVAPPSRVQPKDELGNGNYLWVEGCSLLDCDCPPTLPDWVMTDFGGRARSTPPMGGMDGDALAAWQPTPDTPDERARVSDALGYILPACTRDTYLMVLMALQSTGWQDARELAEGWASRAPHHDGSGDKHGKYDADDFERDWETLKPDGATSLGTLYYIAKHHGFDTSRAKASCMLDTFGDTDNGRRFAERYQGQFRHVRATGEWVRWDGVRWCPSGGEEERAARQIANERVIEAANARHDAPGDCTRSNYNQAIEVQRKRHRHKAMLDVAATEPGMCIAHPGLLDADPWLLGVRNGIVDLRTGALLVPDPGKLISKLAGTSYDHAAQCPRWKEFLNDVFKGDSEIINFIQRAVGYTLTGSVAEEKLFFLHGHGANGKSVFGTVVQAVLGDYALTVGAALLARDNSRKGSEADREKARLPGARLVLVNEVGVNDAWDDQRVKELVSRERVSVRRLYAESFDFMPTHKIWIRANHLPTAFDSGDGFWRRIVQVPFNRLFTEDERVADLDSQIIEAESAGILAWMVEGCLAWQREGLRVPAAIKAEVDTYRRDADVLGEWLAACTQPAPNTDARLDKLYDSYATFMRNGGMTPAARPAFSKKLKERNFRTHRTNKGRFVRGLALRPSDEWVGAEDDEL